MSLKEKVGTDLKVSDDQLGANVINLVTPFHNKLEAFVPVKSFQPSLMFAGKAGAYPCEAHFRCSTLGYAPGLTHKHKTRLQRLARDKYSSLLSKGVTNNRKKFYNIGHWPQSYKTLYIWDLQIFAKSLSVCFWQDFTPSIMFAGKGCA
jgi:hypothetical protein